MKIIIVLLGLAGLLALAGCASAPARGGVSAVALGGSSQVQASSSLAPDSPDYRRILADPGPF